MKIAAAYIRVSTEDQTELSPDSQVKKIREYAEKNGYTLPDEYIFHDDGISGRTTKKRPGFNHMIALAKSNPIPFEAILVWKFSRFARNREDSIVFKSMLKKRGISVVSISEAVGTDKMSILVESLIEAMDEYYSVNLSEEVVRGMNEKVSRGKPVSIAPIGYNIVKGDFVINEETAPLVRRIFNDRLAGIPTREIAMNLNSEGYRTRKGKGFENRTVLYILRNPVYCGYIRWDKEGRGSRGYYKDGTEIIVKGNHEPIVSKEEFDQVQKMDIPNKAKYSRESATTHDFMLRGIIRCSNCGATLCYSANDRLQCHKYAHGSCNESHSISISKLNSAVIDTLKNDIKLIPLTSPKTPRKAIKDNTEELIKKEQTKLKRAEDAYLNGIDSIEEYKVKKLEIVKRIDTLQSKVNRKVEHVSITRNDMKDLISLLDSPDVSDLDKNKALKSFVEDITYDKKKEEITIHYFLP